jgi:FkbM family methyltransferase
MDIFLDPRFDDVYRLHPLVLVDAGARGGLKTNWAAARRHLRTIGFEPDRDEYARLAAARESAQHLICDVALHNRCTPIELHVARDRGLTSLFEPNREFLDAFPQADRFDIVDRRTVDADALDNQLEARGITDVDFLKVDTQGSELFVLQGAARSLSSCISGVEVEVEFSQIYRGQPLFADVDAYLREKGFILFDLRPCYWKRAGGHRLGGPYGQIIWADALYLKAFPALCDATQSMEPLARKGKILKAISISLLYGYFDYALHVVRESTEVFDEAERATIEATLVRAGSAVGPLPRFPGKAKIVALCRRLTRLLRDREDGWSVGEGKTGNLI